MPMSRKYHPVNFKDILNGKQKQNRVLSLLESLKKGEDPLEKENENIIKSLNQTNKNLPVQLTVKAQVQEEDNTNTIDVKVDNDRTQIPEITITSMEEDPGFYANADTKLADANHYLTGALQFIEIVKHASDRLKTCKERITEEDRVIQDLLHEIRQPLKSESEALALYRLLHRAERRRQDFKDLAEPLALLANYINSHQGVFEGFIPIIKLAQQKVASQKDRVYMQKSVSLKLPIGDAYRKLPKQEQDRIKATYEANKKRDKYSYGT